MKKMLSGFMVLLLCFMQCACSKPNEPAKQADELMEKRQKWEYSTETDSFDGTTFKRATILSKNIVPLDAPYGPGTDAILFLGRRNGENMMGIQALRGQFMCMVSSCIVRMKFDDQMPMSFEGTSAVGKESMVVFSSAATNGLIGELKAAKKVTIRMEFYGSGNRDFEFNAGGLVWE